MLTLLKLFLVFSLMVLAVKKKVDIGLTIFFSAIFYAVVFGMSSADAFDSIISGALAFDTLELLAIVFLISLLGNVLKYTEKIDKISQSLEYFFPDIRVSLISIPAFIGFLPMPGGALVSAPILDGIGDKAGLKPELKTSINYWFRHIWEYAFPLYPGVIVSAAIFEITVKEIIQVNWIYPIFAFCFGYIFLLWGVRYSGLKSNSDGVISNLMELIWSIWPVAAVLWLYVLLDIPLTISLTLVIAALFVFSGFFKGFFWKIFPKSFKLDMAFLIIAVMCFKTVVKDSNAISTLPQMFLDFGIPIPLIMFTIPFIVGLLLGITIGYVGIVFPLFTVFIMEGGFQGDLFMLAYVGGYLGVMLSPVHLCLILSKNYFKADLKKVYRQIIKPCIAVASVTWLLYLFGWPP